jgi:hypothetical protein
MKKLTIVAIVITNTITFLLASRWFRERGISVVTQKSSPDSRMASLRSGFPQTDKNSALNNRSLEKEVNKKANAPTGENYVILPKEALRSLAFSPLDGPRLSEIFKRLSGTTDTEATVADAALAECKSAQLELLKRHATASPIDGSNEVTISISSYGDEGAALRKQLEKDIQKTLSPLAYEMFTATVRNSLDSIYSEFGLYAMTIKIAKTDNGFSVDTTSITKTGDVHSRMRQMLSRDQLFSQIPGAGQYLQ